MKLAFTFDHHNASAIWSRRGIQDWLTDVFEAPGIKMEPHCTSEIRAHVEKEFQLDGWALNAKIHQDFLLSVFALKSDLAFQLQTGNISRAPYDLLKLQYLFQSGKIECASIAVPTKNCSKKIGGNLANAERISNELKLFDRVITVPILLVAFE